MNATKHITKNLLSTNVYSDNAYMPCAVGNTQTTLRTKKTANFAVACTQLPYKCISILAFNVLYILSSAGSAQASNIAGGDESTLISTTSESRDMHFRWIKKGDRYEKSFQITKLFMSELESQNSLDSYREFLYHFLFAKIAANYDISFIEYTDDPNTAVFSIVIPNRFDKKDLCYLYEQAVLANPEPPGNVYKSESYFYSSINALLCTTFFSVKSLNNYAKSNLDKLNYSSTLMPEHSVGAIFVSKKQLPEDVILSIDYLIKIIAVSQGVCALLYNESVRISCADNKIKIEVFFKNVAIKRSDLDFDKVTMGKIEAYYLDMAKKSFDDANKMYIPVKSSGNENPEVSTLPINTKDFMPSRRAEIAVQYLESTKRNEKNYMLPCYRLLMNTRKRFSNYNYCFKFKVGQNSTNVLNEFYRKFTDKTIFDANVSFINCDLSYNFLVTEDSIAKDFEHLCLISKYVRCLYYYNRLDILVTHTYKLCELKTESEDIANMRTSIMKVLARLENDCERSLCTLKNDIVTKKDKKTYFSTVLGSDWYYLIKLDECLKKEYDIDDFMKSSLHDDMYWHAQNIHGLRCQTIENYTKQISSLYSNYKQIISEAGKKFILTNVPTTTEAFKPTIYDDGKDEIGNFSKMSLEDRKELLEWFDLICQLSDGLHQVRMNVYEDLGNNTRRK